MEEWLPFVAMGIAIVVWNLLGFRLPYPFGERPPVVIEKKRVPLGVIRFEVALRISEYGLYSEIAAKTLIHLVEEKLRDAGHPFDQTQVEIIGTDHGSLLVDIAYFLISYKLITSLPEFIKDYPDYRNGISSMMADIRTLSVSVGGVSKRWAVRVRKDELYTKSSDLRLESYEETNERLNAINRARNEKNDDRTCP